MKDYDVAIVGGGLLGAAFSWGLADRGLRTVVFDEGDNAIRTARGNFGLVWVQGKGVGMPEYARWSLHSSLLWQGFADRLQEETGIDVHYDRCGGYVICLDDEEYESNQKSLARLKAEAIDQEYEYALLDHAELKMQLPMIGNVAGASFCPHDGHCNPLKLLLALHKGFINKGGDYRPNHHVTEINQLNGGGFEVICDNAVFSAEKVIVSAGHGSVELGNQLGLDIPIHPEQGQILVTEKAEKILRHPTNYVRQTDEGGFLLGPSSSDVGYSLDTNPLTLKEIAARCVRAFPKLESLRIQRCWAALRVMTPDGFPVYQQSGTRPGAFSFACHSGVTLAASHALEVSQWVESGGIPDRYQVFHPDRFHV